MIIFIPFYSAYFCASANTLISNTSKQAYLNYNNIYSYFRFYGIYESIDFIALITSSLDTGPTEMWETGIFSVFKY